MWDKVKELGYNPDDLMHISKGRLTFRHTIETGWKPVPEDRIVTLSTCTEDHGTRYTVQGVLIFAEEKQLAKEDSDRAEVHVE